MRRMYAVTKVGSDVATRVTAVAWRVEGDTVFLTMPDGFVRPFRNCARLDVRVYEGDQLCEPSTTST